LTVPSDGQTGRNAKVRVADKPGAIGRRSHLPMAFIGAWSPEDGPHRNKTIYYVHETAQSEFAL